MTWCLIPTRSRSQEIPHFPRAKHGSWAHPCAPAPRSQVAGPGGPPCPLQPPRALQNPPLPSQSSTSKALRPGREGATAPHTRGQPRPCLTCLNRIREVMSRGRSPRKLLQLPGAQVQAPRVGRLLQRALQPTVQGQVEARAARASVVLVVLVEMRVQGGYRESGRESLGFASRRRHLLPVPRPAAPARGHRSPRRPGVPAALPRKPRDCWRGGGRRRAGGSSSIANVSSPGSGGLRRRRRRRRACVCSCSRLRPPLLLRGFWALHPRSWLELDAHSG